MATGQTGRAPDTRRAPTVYSDAQQEAKRLEKMQSVCSSHRTHGTVGLPPTDTRPDPRR